MIPPPLREALVRKLTQKLVESPTFNSLVHNTQGTIAAFLDGIDEGRKQKETAEVKRSDTHEHQEAPRPQQQQQQDPQPHQPSTHQTYSRTHDFEKPRSSTMKDPRTPPPASESSTSSNATPSGHTDLEAFLRRTKASLEEAERRAEAQRKNKP